MFKYSKIKILNDSKQCCPLTYWDLVNVASKSLKRVYANIVCKQQLPRRFLFKEEILKF